MNNEFKFRVDKTNFCDLGIRTPDLLMKFYWGHHCTIITSGIWVWRARLQIKFQKIGWLALSSSNTEPPSSSNPLSPPTPPVLSQCDLSSIASLDQHSTAIVVECHRLSGISTTFLPTFCSRLKWCYIPRGPSVPKLREKLLKTAKLFRWMPAGEHGCGIAYTRLPLISIDGVIAKLSSGVFVRVIKRQFFNTCSFWHGAPARRNFSNSLRSRLAHTKLVALWVTFWLRMPRLAIKWT